MSTESIDSSLSILEMVTGALDSHVAKVVKKSSGASGPKRKKPITVAKELVAMRILVNKGEKTKEEVATYINELTTTHGQEYMAEVVAEFANVKTGKSGGTRGPSLDSYDNLLHIRELMLAKGLKSVTGNERELLGQLFPPAEGSEFNLESAREQAIAAGIKFNSLAVVSATEGEEHYNPTFAQALKCVKMEFSKHSEKADNNPRGSITRMTLAIKKGAVEDKPANFGVKGAGLAAWREKQNAAKASATATV